LTNYDKLQLVCPKYVNPDMVCTSKNQC